MLAATTNNFLIPNATIVVEIIAFVIILAILRRYVLPPLQKAMNQRQEEIRSSLEEAERGRQLLRDAERARQTTIDDTRREARGIVEQATRLSEQMRQDARNKADEEHATRLAQAQTEIERATQRASEELRQQVADLVTETTRKVLGRDLTPEMQADLVDEVTSGVESRV